MINSQQLSFAGCSCWLPVVSLKNGSVIMGCNCCSNTDIPENEELDYICYCNKITKQEIINTVKTTSLKKINEIKKYLRKEIITDCENRHPLKRCCNPEFKKTIMEGLIMSEKKQENDTTEKKGFFQKIFKKLDEKLEEKSKQQSSCCGPKKPDGKSSCC